MYNLNDTMSTDVIVKKWGNSLAVVFPKDFVREKNINVNDKISIEVVKPADFTKVFGSLRKKMSGQEFKDFVRKGWK